MDGSLGKRVLLPLWNSRCLVRFPLSHVKIVGGRDSHAVTLNKSLELSNSGSTIVEARRYRLLSGSYAVID